MMIIANKIKMFLADEQGAETVEWVMIAGILVLIIVSVYNNALYNGLDTAMSNLVDKLETPPALGTN